MRLASRIITHSDRVGIGSAQDIATFVTLPEAVPDPFVTVQTWPAGCVFTVTAYAAPGVSGVAKAKAPLAKTVRSSLPLFSKTKLLPEPNPLMVPLTVTRLVT